MTAAEQSATRDGSNVQQGEPVDPTEAGVNEHRGADQMDDQRPVFMEEGEDAAMIGSVGVLQDAGLKSDIGKSLSALGAKFRGDVWTRPNLRCWWEARNARRLVNS